MRLIELTETETVWRRGQVDLDQLIEEYRTDLLDDEVDTADDKAVMEWLIDGQDAFEGVCVEYDSSVEYDWREVKGAA